MSEIRSAKREAFDKLAREFLSLRGTKEQVGVRAFVRQHGLLCNPSTFFRRVKDYENRAANGLLVTPTAPWSILPSPVLGGFLAHLDLYNDRLRKRRGLQPLSSVIATFKKWCRNEHKLELTVSNYRLREIAHERMQARLSLDDEGRAVYQAIAGGYYERRTSGWSGYKLMRPN